MYLSSLALSHYRSHLRARLDLDARPVAVYGPNGAGKTNLIEAVSLLSPGRGLRRAASDDLARLPEAVGWRVDAEIMGAGGAHQVRLRAEPGASRQVIVDDKPAAQTALGSLLRIVWLVPSMDRLWIEGAEGRRRFLDRMALSFFPDHAQMALDYEKAMRERNRLLKDQVRDPHWYGALEAQMATAGRALHDRRLMTLDRLAGAQAVEDGPFPAAALDLVQADGALPESVEALRAALAANRRADMAAGRSLIGPHRSDLRGRYAAKDMPAEKCSTGEQKALLISLILANARAIRDEIGATPIMLLDEIAAHLDAGRRAALYDRICALGAQAWMTGTGAELFAELEGRAQMVSVTEGAGGSVVAMR